MGKHASLLTEILSDGFFPLSPALLSVDDNVGWITCVLVLYIRDWWRSTIITPWAACWLAETNSLFLDRLSVRPLSVCLSACLSVWFHFACLVLAMHWMRWPGLSNYFGQPPCLMDGVGDVSVRYVVFPPPPSLFVWIYRHTSNSPFASMSCSFVLVPCSIFSFLLLPGCLLLFGHPPSGDYYATSFRVQSSSFGMVAWLVLNEYCLDYAPTNHFEWENMLPY